MKKTFFFLVVFLLSYGSLHSQESLPRVGIGLSLNEVRKYMYVDEIDNAQYIYVPINISKSFRLEPQLGYNKYSREPEFKFQVQL